MGGAETLSERRPGVSRWREGVGLGVGHVYIFGTVHGERRFIPRCDPLKPMVFFWGASIDLIPQISAFSNLWRTECSRGARRRAWKRSGHCRALQATASTCDNLVWQPYTRKLRCAKLREQLLHNLRALYNNFCAGPLPVPFLTSNGT